MISIWTILYLLSITVGFIIRIKDQGSYTSETYYFNGAAIALVGLGLILFFKRINLGKIILQIASLARIGVIFMVMTIYLGFIAAYTPASPIIWLPAFQWGNPWVHIICTLLLVIELFYYRRLKEVRF